MHQGQKPFVMHHISKLLSIPFGKPLEAYHLYIIMKGCYLFCITQLTFIFFKWQFPLWCNLCENVMLQVVVKYIVGLWWISQLKTTLSLFMQLRWPRNASEASHFVLVILKFLDSFFQSQRAKEYVTQFWELYYTKTRNYNHQYQKTSLRARVKFW
jgi:hypothetical protein